MTQAPTLFSIANYPPPGVPGGVPATNDAGGSTPSMTSYTIPPVMWMFIFLVVGYIGLRMILED